MVYAGAAYCSAGRVATWSTMNEVCQERTSSFEVGATVEAQPINAQLTQEYFGYMGVDHDRQWVVAAFKGLFVLC